MSSKRSPDIDNFIALLPTWADEVEALRAIVLSCDVEEVLKWKQPAYTVNGANTIIISTRKSAAVS